MTESSLAITRVRFLVGMPLERMLATLRGAQLENHHAELLDKLAVGATEVWKYHGQRAVPLFEQMYQCSLPQEPIPAFVSFMAPNPISQPIVLKFAMNDSFESVETRQRLVNTLVHQMAHQFLPLGRGKRLVEQVSAAFPGQSPGANEHIVLHALELGIASELFGRDHAVTQLHALLDHRLEDYRVSARWLIDQDLPLDPTSLDTIERRWSRSTV